MRPFFIAALAKKNIFHKGGIKAAPRYARPNAHADGRFGQISSLTVEARKKHQSLKPRLRAAATNSSRSKLLSLSPAPLLTPNEL